MIKVGSDFSGVGAFNQALTSVQKDNVVIVQQLPARAREDGSGQPVIKNEYKIRRPTPREISQIHSHGQ